MFISIGLCLSAYCIYKNKELVFLNLAKMGVKIEDIYFNYKGTNMSYLVPNYENKTLINKCNKFNLQKYLDDIYNNKSYNINNNNYFVVLNYSIKRKTLCYVKNSLIFSDKEITEDDINYLSPIILCSVNINQRINGDVKKIFTNYDITNIINYLVNRNTKIILSNLPKYKEFWIFYFNYFLQDRNVFINIDNNEEIEIEWNIMKDNLQKIEGKEILISTDETKTNISIISSNNIEKIISENEYDSIDDINISKFKKQFRNKNLIMEVINNEILNSNIESQQVLDVDNENESQQVLDVDNENESQQVLDNEDESQQVLDNEDESQQVLDIDNEDESQQVLEDEDESQKVLDIDNENESQQVLEDEDESQQVLEDEDELQQEDYICKKVSCEIVNEIIDNVIQMNEIELNN